MLAVLATHRDAGESREEALRGYAGEVAFTLFDRLVTFRCLEERGLLLVDGQAESLVRRDLVRGTSSLIWRTRDANPGLDERAIARTAYRAACAAMTDRVKVLFDPDDEPSAPIPDAAALAEGDGCPQRSGDPLGHLRPGRNHGLGIPVLERVTQARALRTGPGVCKIAEDAILQLATCTLHAAIHRRLPGPEHARYDLGGDAPRLGPTCDLALLRHAACG